MSYPDYHAASADSDGVCSAESGSSPPEEPADSHALPQGEPGGMLAEYQPVQRRRETALGWTAARQRSFLIALSETGSVREACRQVMITPRSAYRLRQRPDAAAFARAWDTALRLASARLIGAAYDRAINGSAREMWRNGVLVSEVRAPSDRLLMFLIDRLMPRAAGGVDGEGVSAMLEEAGVALPDALGKLTDSDLRADPLDSSYDPDAMFDPALSVDW